VPTALTFRPLRLDHTVWVLILKLATISQHRIYCLIFLMGTTWDRIDQRIARLLLRSPGHFAWLSSARVLPTLLTSLLGRMIAVTRKQTYTGTSIALTAETHWCRTSRTLMNCDLTLGPLILPAPEAGGFVELTLLYQAACQLWMGCSFVIIKSPCSQSTLHVSLLSFASCCWLQS
jgi:hypothetical protein